MVRLDIIDHVSYPKIPDGDLYFLIKYKFDISYTQ